MIIELKVKNFLSIREEQTLSLVASPATELNDNVFQAGKDSPLNLVRSAAIYGANASGKSNLLSALLFMQELVVLSAKESQQGEQISVTRFAFNKKNQSEPSEFEVTFIKEGVRYQYGFTLDEDRIFEEWLFAYPSNHSQQWFSRIYDVKDAKYFWKFSKFFKGEKKIFANHTIANELFLSHAVKNNNEQLIPVFSWFQKDLFFLDLAREEINYGKSIKNIKSTASKEKILQIINVADSSIADIKINKFMINEKNLPSFPDSIPLEVKNFFKKEMMKEQTKIDFLHSGNVLLDFAYESDGTRKSFALAGYWIDVLENGGILIIDELDNSLHPHMVLFLINLINNPKINKKNAQLIFATHDTSLLDNEIFRRDQIWFVEKDKNYATQLYPLLDFSPRKHEAIGRGYLQGRYGALPYIGEWRF
jgi:uncharacterized protein